MIKAEITINPTRESGEVDPLFFGQYVESLDPPAKPIYGGVCDDDGNLREDVIRDLQEMVVPVIRWGGNYGDIMQWKEGIGPRENRPMRYNYQWGGYESNRFGTHEFLTLCERLNAHPYININLGTGSLLDALGWLEYCNHAGDTEYTRLRQQNGRATPWHVPIWGIGNESWGKWETSYSTPEVYADRFNRFAYFMRSFDPTIKLIAVGWIFSEWNRAVLRGIDVSPEYLSVHLYGHSHIGAENNYARLVGTPLLFEHILVDRVKEDIRRYGKKPVGIVVDEWNVRHFFDGKINRASPRRMEDAIFSAGFLNAMLRQASVVKMTNQTCMVNSLAPLIATSTGTIRTPLYDVFMLYQKLCLKRVVDTQVISPVYFCKPTPCTSIDPLAVSYDAPYLDAATTSNAEKSRFTTVLINRHDQEWMQISVRFAYAAAPRRAVLWQLTAENPAALQASVQTIALDQISEISLPPHSVSFLVME